MLGIQPPQHLVALSDGGLLTAMDASMERSVGGDLDSAPEIILATPGQHDDCHQGPHTSRSPLPLPNGTVPPSTGIDRSSTSGGAVSRTNGSCQTSFTATRTASM